MEDITNGDYMHGKRVFKDFEIKHLSKYHDFYLKSDKLLLADVFENFSKMSLKIYHLDPIKLLSASGWAWQALLIRIKIRIIKWYWNAINDWKEIRGGICHAIQQYAKGNTK